jgi:hypothetical protein
MPNIITAAYIIAGFNATVPQSTFDTRGYTNRRIIRR